MLMPRTLIAWAALLMTLSAPPMVAAQPGVPARAPALDYREASGCPGLFLYAWNADRSEVLTVRADRASVKLPDGTTTLNLATTGPGVAVRVEMTAPRENLPFCSDEGTKDGERPTVWTAVAGTVRIMLKRRPKAAFVPVTVFVNDLVLRAAEGTEVKQRRELRFTAAITDLDQ